MGEDSSIRRKNVRASEHGCPPGEWGYLGRFFNVEDGRPYVAHWTAGTTFSEWSLTALGDARYVEGEHPSIAIDESGFVAVVWYRCLRVGRGTTCDPQDDAVVFAWYVDDEWLTEVIDNGEMGLCGRYPNLKFGADNKAIVVYQCVFSGDSFEFEHAMPAGMYPMTWWRLFLVVGLLGCGAVEEETKLQGSVAVSTRSSTIRSEPYCRQMSSQCNSSTMAQ